MNKDEKEFKGHLWKLHVVPSATYKRLLEYEYPITRDSEYQEEYRPYYSEVLSWLRIVHDVSITIVTGIDVNNMMHRIEVCEYYRGQSRETWYYVHPGELPNTIDVLINRALDKIDLI